MQYTHQFWMGCKKLRQYGTPRKGTATVCKKKGNAEHNLQFVKPNSFFLSFSNLNPIFLFFLFTILFVFAFSFNSVPFNSRLPPSLCLCASRTLKQYFVLLNFYRQQRKEVLFSIFSLFNLLGFYRDSEISKKVSCSIKFTSFLVETPTISLTKPNWLWIFKDTLLFVYNEVGVHLRTVLCFFSVIEGSSVEKVMNFDGPLAGFEETN